MEPRLSITIGDQTIPIECQQALPAGKVIVGGRVITHPLIIGEPAFIKQPYHLESLESIGIAYASVLYIDTPTNQEIISYGDQKPMVLISSDKFAQFIVQPLTYLKGRLQTPMLWELSTMEVTVKTTLRVGRELTQGE